MLDTSLWIPLFALLGIALIVRFAWKPKPRKVLRISADSLEASRKLALQILPLVEESGSHPLDEGLLPCPKSRVKSALKILAHQFSRNGKQEELTRIRNCYVSLSRFQDLGLAGEQIETVCATERERLDCEINKTILDSRNR